jgi:hypothetical protein
MANSICYRAVFLAKPVKRTFANPNCSLITRKGCSALAQTLALSFSSSSISHWLTDSAAARWLYPAAQRRTDPAQRRKLFRQDQRLKTVSSTIAT